MGLIYWIIRRRWVHWALHDAGPWFDIEVNAGGFLAGDWEQPQQSPERLAVDGGGGYATLTDVPFKPLEKVHSTRLFL